MLTDAQAKTLIVLNYAWHWFTDDRPTIQIAPTDAFPNRDNTDNGHRRNLRKLADNGLGKELVFSGKFYGLEFNCERLRTAYREWYQKRGWKQYDSNPVLP
jgi:hypothetical protein